MKVDQVIKEINEQLESNYYFISKFTQGEWGAHLVAQDNQEPLVLKYFLDLEPTNITDAQTQTSQLITHRLKDLGAPVPKIVELGQLESGGYWWLLERMKGKPIQGDPQLAHIKHLLHFLDLHKNQAVSQKQNWSKLVTATLFEESKQKQFLLKYSESTSKLLDQILNNTTQFQEIHLRNNDIVHGDMSYHQLLVKKNQVTAILDWQESGCGDYLIDLSRLIYSLHDRPRLVKPILKKMVVKDLPKLKLFTAFHILDYLYWPAKHSSEKVEAALNKARSAFEFVFHNNQFLTA